MPKKAASVSQSMLRPAYSNADVSVEVDGASYHARSRWKVGSPSLPGNSPGNGQSSQGCAVGSFPGRRCVFFMFFSFPRDVEVVWQLPQPLFRWGCENSTIVSYLSGLKLVDGWPPSQTLLSAGNLAVRSSSSCSWLRNCRESCGNPQWGAGGRAVDGSNRWSNSPENWNYQLIDQQQAISDSALNQNDMPNWFCSFLGQKCYRLENPTIWSMNDENRI